MTCCERTIIDLAACLPPTKVGLAIDDALRRRITTIERLFTELHTTGGRGRRGSKSLRMLLQTRDHGDAAMRSAFESRMRRILRQIGVESIPDFKVNARGQAYFLDFYVPTHRLAIECHSLKWHAGQDWLKKDVRRHRDLDSVGIKVLYFTWDEVYFEPDRVTRDIREALGQRSLLRISDLP